MGTQFVAMQSNAIMANEFIRIISRNFPNSLNLLIEYYINAIMRNSED